MKAKHFFLKECYLQKTNHYDALELLANDTYKKYIELWKDIKLKYGKIEEDDKEFVYAYVNVKGNDNEKKIGILLEEDANLLKPYLQMDWGDLFECKICKYDENADENKRFGVAIYVKRKKTNLIIV